MSKNLIDMIVTGEIEDSDDLKRALKLPDIEYTEDELIAVNHYFKVNSKPSINFEYDIVKRGSDYEHPVTIGTMSLNPDGTWSRIYDGQI